MARAVVFGCGALAFFAVVSESLAEPVPQSVSTSRQFIVYGTDLAVRGAICDLAERTKRELLATLGQRDEWSTAIVINARYPQANLPELPRLNVALAQTGFGLKVHLDLVIDPAVSRTEIRRELLRALTLEMMYRREPQLPSGATYTSPPDWFLDGIPSEQSDFPRERVVALLASAASRNVWPLPNFLGQRVELLDAAARNLYRAYSFALVDLLTHERTGPLRLTQFLLDLSGASDDSTETLRKHFPEIFQTEGEATTWQKRIARFSSDQPFQLLSSPETERQLEETLRFTMSDRGQRRRYNLIEFPIFPKNTTAKSALAHIANNLTALATRAHPVYAPIIAEYARTVWSIQHGKTLGVGRRLEQLASTRKAMSAQTREIDDYLNWFEATGLIRPSGQFADYMKAAERAAHPERTRRDRISIYLDAVETQLEEEKPAIR